MPTCAVYGCRNRSNAYKAGVTFHKFPKDENRRNEWVKAIKRENWQPTSSSSLCSEHFTEEDIDRTSLAVVRIRENAIPKLNLPTGPVPQKERKKRRRKRKSKPVSDTSESDFDFDFDDSPKEDVRPPSKNSNAATSGQALSTGENSQSKLAMTAPYKKRTMWKVRMRRFSNSSEEGKEKATPVKSSARSDNSTANSQKSTASARKEASTETNNAHNKDSDHALRQRLIAVEKKLNLCEKKLKQVYQRMQTLENKELDLKDVVDYLRKHKLLPEENLLKLEKAEENSDVSSKVEEESNANP